MIELQVRKSGDDVYTFQEEVESFLKNNGYSLKRTSENDFGALHA